MIVHLFHRLLILITCYNFRYDYGDDIEEMIWRKVVSAFLVYFTYVKYFSILYRVSLQNVSIIVTRNNIIIAFFILCKYFPL